MANGNGEKTNKAMALLEDGVRELTNDDAWRAWLAAQAKFHRYSFGNCLLIGMQRPDATRVAGFHTWLELGYGVRKGEKGIAILAPIVKKVAETEDGEDVKRAVFFKTVYVFDIAQVDALANAKPLAAVGVEKLEGEAPAGLFAQLTAIAHARGFSVELVDSIVELPSANGMTDHSKKRVVVNGKLSAAMQCKTMAHELAHVILHEPTASITLEEAQTRRSLAELEAESVAYVVMHASGITDNGYSFGYIANWAKEASADVIRKRGEVISKTAREILDALEEKEIAA